MSAAKKRPSYALWVGGILIVLLLSACGSNPGISNSATNAPAPVTNASPKAPYSQQVYHLPANDITTFDPALTADIYSTLAIRMIFGTLLQVDGNMQLQPYMAQSWQQSPDGLQWTFHLQPDLTFSDGTPLTSQDVAYSIDRALQPATQSPNALSFLELLQDAQELHSGQIKTVIGDSVVPTDPSTIILKLTKKAAYFPFILTMPATAVIQKKMIDKYGNAKFTDHLTDGGGSGPFILARYTPQKEIDFVPNPYYYGLKPQLREVIFNTDPAQDTYRDYQDGLADVTGIPYADLKDAQQRTSEYHQASRLQIDYLAMNFLAKPFDNLHIRQAFALSINREKLNHDLYDDTLIPTYHIIPQGMQGYNLNLVGPAGIKDSRGSPDTARKLFALGLQEEGWSNVSQMPPIKFSYSTGDDAFMSALQQIWQSVLGVKIIPDPLDFSALLKKIDDAMGNPNGAQIWSLSWAANYPDAHDWTTHHFGKGAAENKMNYGQNNSADALQEQAVQDQLARADAESNPDVRVQLYQSAEQQLINQVAWIPLFQETRMNLLKPYVKGVIFNPLGTRPPMEWANIYIAAH